LRAERLGSLSKGFVLKTKGVFLKTKGVFLKTKGLLLKTRGLFSETRGLSLESKPLRLESESLFVESERRLHDRRAHSWRTKGSGATSLASFCVPTGHARRCREVGQGPVRTSFT
jgi:hypothetical protein